MSVAETAVNALQVTGVVGSSATAGSVKDAVLDYVKNTINPDVVTDSAYFNQADLYFPSDLTSYPYYITLDFRKFVRPTIQSIVQFETLGKVRLPVPGNLHKDSRQQYSTDEMGPIAGAALQSAVQGDLTSTAAGMAAKLVSGPVQQVAFQVMGLTINPFLTVMFKGPSFRRYRFAWRLAPNNEQESVRVKRIIDKLEYHSSSALWNPGMARGVILKYPDLVRATLQPDDRYTFKFKPMVLESVSVNYTPNGVGAWFDKTKAPEQVELSINLLETQYWLKDDFSATSMYNPDRRTVINSTAETTTQVVR